MSRQKVFEAWTERASSDLATRARTHALPRPTAVTAASGTGQWRGAAARIDLSRELFRNPAGWSARAQPGEGWIGHRFGRLCLLEAPDGQRVLFGVLDALAGSRWLAEALGRSCAGDGLDVGRIFLGCTHSHGAGGSMFGDLFYDTLASGTTQRFDALGVAWLERRLRRAVQELVPALEDVTLAAGEGVLPHGLLWQRAVGPYLARFGDPARMTSDQITAFSQRPHPTGWEPSTVAGNAVERASLRAVEPRVPVWSVRRADGSLLFASATVDATGALLMPKAELMSSDVFGAAALSLEAQLKPSGGRDAVVAVVAGSKGDVNVSAPGQRVREVLDARSQKRRSADTLGRVALRYVQHSGEAMAQAIAPAISGAVAVAASGMDVRFAEAFAPGAAVESRAEDVPAGEVPPPMNVRRLPWAWNFGRAVTQGAEFSQPDPSDDLFVLGPRSRVDWIDGHVDPWGVAGLSELLFLRPKEVVYSPFLPVRIVRLGSIVWVGMPAEPAIAIGERVRALFPGTSVHVCGSVGAFTGYADTVAAGQMQEYEGASSYWGRDFGAYLVQQVERLASVNGFTRTTGVPDEDAWLVGGQLTGTRAVGGVARFSLTRARAFRVDRSGPGRPLSGRVAGFVRDVRIPVQTPLPTAPAWCVRGYWRPQHAAAKRSAREDISWPRLAEDGPIVIIDLEGGGKVRSDEVPMVIRWDGDLWQVHAELSVRPERFWVEGVDEVKPIGSVAVPYTG